MTPPEPVSPEDVAAVCRAKLRQSLLVTSQLLRMEATPAESLLARMNDLLAGAVESNFGSASHEQVRALYAAIARLQPQLIDHCEHLSLLYLARSLAVVIEEAVRQKEQLTATLEQDARQREEEAMRSALIAEAVLQQQKEPQQQQPVEKLPELHGKEELTGAVEGYGSKEKTNEEEYGSEKKEEYGSEKKEEGKGTVAAEYGSYTSNLFGSEKIDEKDVKKVDEYGTVEDTVADQGNCIREGEAGRKEGEKEKEEEEEAVPPLSPWEDQTMFMPSMEEKQQFHLDSFVQSPPGLPAAALPEEDDSSYVYTTLPVEVETMDKEQMKGVLTIHGVSPHIGEEQLRSFLEVFGTLQELRHYPKWEGWPTGFAVCRYESEDVARAALAQLNTKRLFGTELYVRSLAALLPRLKRAESATGADALRASPTNTDSSAPEADGDATGADAARASPSNTDTVVGEDTVALDSDDTDTEAVFEDSWDSLDEVD